MTPWWNATGRTAAGAGSTPAVGDQKKLVIFLQREPFLHLEIFCSSLGCERCTQPLEYIFEWQIQHLNAFLFGIRALKTSQQPVPSLRPPNNKLLLRNQPCTEHIGLQIFQNNFFTALFDPTQRNHKAFAVLTWSSCRILLITLSSFASHLDRDRICHVCVGLWGRCEQWLLLWAVTFASGTQVTTFGRFSEVLGCRLPFNILKLCYFAGFYLWCCSMSLLQVS